MIAVALRSLEIENSWGVRDLVGCSHWLNTGDSWQLMMDDWSFGLCLEGNENGSNDRRQEQTNR